MVKSGAKWREECLKMLMGEFQHNLDAKGRLFMPVSSARLWEQSLF